MTNSPNDLSVGSIWRRWDPHVHMPGTLLENHYGQKTVEDALRALAACEPPIECIGVTDYFTTRSFRAAQDAWKAGSGSSIKYLFPNVELRLNDVTAAGNGVNIHLLAAPENVDILDEVLGRLSFTFGDVQYRADDPGLIKLGRAFAQDSAYPEDAARSAGAQQFKVSITELRGIFQSDTRVREACLVAVAAGKDGTSGLQAKGGGFDAHRQGLERFAHIIFSANEGDRDFWLGHKADNELTIKLKYGGLKPCLHGSDAHQFSKLGKPDHDRFCWLKGDPTFDTLWHACLAPERRANINSSSPGAGQHGRIDGVTIDDDTWFTPGTVPINTGLVAVIGPRGSGKTALADLVAVGAGSAEPFENDSSFVRRAGGLLAGQTATVAWHDDDPTRSALLPADGASSGSRRVRYLSQQFVERLCASHGVTNELLGEIERVIFEAWPIEERQGATSFRELLDIRLAAARAQQDEELQALTTISDAIANQRVLQKQLPARKEERGKAAATISNLEAQIKELTGKADAASSERHALVSGHLAKRQGELQAVDRRLTDLKGLQAKVATYLTVHFPGIPQRLKEEFPYVGLSEAEWASFVPTFSGDVTVALAEASTEVSQSRSAIAGTVVDGSSGFDLDGLSEAELRARTLAELTFEQQRLQQLVGLDTKRAQLLTQLQAQLTKARASASKLDVTVATGAAATDRISQLVGERGTRYEAYFNALLIEEAELRTLYSPLEKLLDGFGPTVARLRLSVRRKVNLDAWVAHAERRLIDLRTAGPFRRAGGLRPIAEAALLTAWETGDAATAAAAIQAFSQEHSSSLRDHAPSEVREGEDSYREWQREVSRWLYGVSHISVAYNLEYDGLNVERLSPGSRGIVLLLLYLAVDQSETDPLIIDQPEENLDPKSVYSELVALFQSASERRQIIMVTHNANLVVNTDVDQVIVASCGPLDAGKLPTLAYRAGGLEDPNIRQAVCEVLEGGAEAFQQRARRLHVDAPFVPRLDADAF